MEDLVETKVQVFREDETDGVPVKFDIPPGAELEEIKEKMFKLVYPNCGEPPLECKLVTIGHADIYDVSVLIAVPDGKIVVAPGPNFVDKSGRKKAREKEEKEKEKQREKEEKQREKEEKQREKEEKEKDKKEKSNSLTRRGSLFETFRKKTNPIASSLSKDSSSDGGGEETRSDFAKVYHKGYLNKKNEVLAGGKIPNRNWLTYWVVLRSYHLLFYKERKHYTAQKPPVGGLDIKDCVVELVFEYKKRDHVFRLKTSRGASYLLEAESLEEMTAWLTYIEQASKFDADAPTEENANAEAQKPTSEAFEDEHDNHQEDAPTPRSKLSPEEENNLAEEEKRLEEGN